MQGSGPGRLFLTFGVAAFAQVPDTRQDATIDEIVVTGSRIRRDPINEPTALLEISRSDLERNPYNPFGVDLSPGNGTLEFFGRRPLESGRRLFYQRVHTWFGTTGLNGEFELGSRNLFWELYGSYGENRGSQKKYNSHNAAKLQVAMGDPDLCAATPGCVPFNFFGGQGPDGNGSITPEMLDFVTHTQRDASRQSLKNVALNFAGDVFSLPAGEAGFAAGIEFRDHAGWFRPDPIAERGETAGIPAGSTQGGFRATEYYGELSLPLMDAGARYLELNLAGRSSDYSTFGTQATYKVSMLFRPIEDLSLRASASSGFRTARELTPTRPFSAPSPNCAG